MTTEDHIEISVHIIIIKRLDENLISKMVIIKDNLNIDLSKIIFDLVDN